MHELCALNRLPVRAATPQQRAGSRPPRPPALRSNSTGRRTSHSGAHRGSTDSWRVFPPPHSDSVQAQATLSVFSLSLSPRTEDHDDDEDQLTPCLQATIESDPTDLVFGVEPVYVYAAATLGCVALGWLAGPTVGGALWKLSHRGVGKAMEAKDKGELALHHRLSLLGDGERGGLKRTSLPLQNSSSTSRGGAQTRPGSQVCMHPFSPSLPLSMLIACDLQTQSLAHRLHRIAPRARAATNPAPDYYAEKVGSLRQYRSCVPLSLVIFLVEGPRRCGWTAFARALTSKLGFISLSLFPPSRKPQKQTRYFPPRRWLRDQVCSSALFS